jgi:hypothetical protein
MKRERETVAVELRYVVAEQDPARGIYSGGVADPPTDELALWREAHARPDGADELHLGGPAHALEALGTYFVALSRYCTIDPAYHDHFDDWASVEERPPCTLLARGPADHGDQTTRVELETVDVELRYLVDDRGGPLDASGAEPPQFQPELSAWLDDDGGRTVATLTGSRRALAALGAYLIALARRPPAAAGSFDTLDELHPAAGHPRIALVVHAPR